MSDNDLDQGIRGILDPGYISKDELKKKERDRFYKENIEGKVPYGAHTKAPPEDPITSYLVSSSEPILNFKPGPVVTKKTGFSSDKELEDYMVKSARDKEMVRKARQDPKFVEAHNKRFGPAFKTTVLPKDKPMNVVSYVNKMNKLYGNSNEVDDDHPYLKHKDDQLKEIMAKGKSITLPLMAEPGATPEQMRGLEKRLENSRAFGYDPNRDPKNRAKAFERMAQDEADSINFIKRTNWERENGGRGPKPKYVSKDDVMNVYLKPGAPLPPKRLHKEIEMRKLALSEDPVKSTKTINQLKALNNWSKNQTERAVKKVEQRNNIKGGKNDQQI